jgi:two-component system, response regulator YesN
VCAPAGRRLFFPVLADTLEQSLTIDNGLFHRGNCAVARIVVVDDDHLVLYAISSYLTGSGSAHSVIGSFTDPAKAAHFLSRTPCDVLITDIKMPKLSGFQLIEHAKAAHPGLRVIVLSGHADFSLARDALALKVDEYLLKHEIDQQSLLKVLSRLAPSPPEAEPNRTGGMKTIDQIFKASVAPDGNGYLVAVYAVKPRYDDEGRETGSMPNLLILYQMIEEKLRWLGQGECFLGSHQDIAILHLVPEEVPLENQHRVLQHLREILSTTSRYLNYGAFIATANRLHPPGETEAGYAEARSNLSQAFFLTENTLILPSQCGAGEIGRDDIPQLLFHETFLPDSWPGHVEAFFAAPFREMTDGARRLKLHISVALESINSLLLRSFSTSFEQILGETAGSLYERIFQMDDERALKALLIWLGGRIGEEISHHRHTRTVVGSVQAYIERNYARPLSLNEIADIFSINMSYLCTLFKQETGTNFTDYVHRVRLHHACELFSDRGLSLKEIAFAVGYQSADHFSRVFSHIMGDTATVYRDRLLRQAEGSSAP